MIKVNALYGITSDKHGYQVIELPIRQDKNGKDIYSYISYHGSVEEALTSIVKQMQRNFVAQNDINITEAIKEFKHISNDLMGKLKIIDG